MPDLLRRIMFLALIFTPPVSAQSEKTIDYLQSQPFTVFDFGLYRITEELEEWVSYQRFDLPNNSNIDFRVVYRQHDKRIQIRYVIGTPRSYLYEITVKEKACGRVIDAMRRYFHTDDSSATKKLSTEERREKGIYRFFSRSTVSLPERPDEMMNDIETSTEILVTLIRGKRGKDRFGCRGSLLGSDITYIEDMAAGHD